jgi:hypothetical protein
MLVVVLPTMRTTMANLPGVQQRTRREREAQHRRANDAWDADAGEHDSDSSENDQPSANHGQARDRIRRLAGAPAACLDPARKNGSGCHGEHAAEYDRC